MSVLSQAQATSKEKPCPSISATAPKGLLTKSAKAEIADEITTIHTTATGARGCMSTFSSTRFRKATASLRANRQVTLTFSARSPRT